MKRKEAEEWMIIALTGTPGVGKTSVCDHLKRMHFSSVMHVIDLNEIIRGRYHRGYDKKRSCFIADLRRLRRHVRGVHRRMLRKNNTDARGGECDERSVLLLLDGHLSHLLHPDITIILRASPAELARRLRRKGFDARKTEENVHAEMLDVILTEAVERCKVVYEIDTTKMRVEDVAAIVHEIIDAESSAEMRDRRDELRDRYAPGSIDWSGYVMSLT